MKNVAVITLVVVAWMVSGGCGNAVDTVVVAERYYIEDEADALLRRMGDYLKNAEAFAVQAESSYDVVEEGHTIRYGGVAEVVLRRPDGLRVVFKGDERRTQTFFDGKTMTIYDEAVNMYAVTDVPPEIGSALDTVFDLYGISVPLSDYVYADPYSILIENVLDARWVGLHTIEGVPCDHLAFVQESIDWEIWIEAGDRPVPRQVLITYKNDPIRPQYFARLRNWDFQPQFAENDFRFQPPAGADQMGFLIIPETEVNND